MTGTVRWFEPRKGFGFIEPEDGAGDVYVHYGCMARTDDSPSLGAVHSANALEPGEKVQFEVVQGPYGRQATQVRRADV
jgi:CspA family cold shock protein